MWIAVYVQITKLLIENLLAQRCDEYLKRDMLNMFKGITREERYFGTLATKYQGMLSHHMGQVVKLELMC